MVHQFNSLCNSGSYDYANIVKVVEAKRNNSIYSHFRIIFREVANSKDIGHLKRLDDLHFRLQDKMEKFT
jgi:hypothetical protein